MSTARRRAPRFALEALETRNLLSAMPAHAAAATASKPSPAAFFTSDSTTQSQGRIATLRSTFSGQVLSQGMAKATSTEVLDTRTNALKSVQIVVQTNHGTLRLRFGPSDVTKNVSTSAATELVANYHVVSGTGVFAHGAQPGTVTFWSVGGDTGSEMTITPTGS
jgi:hypothetical protein